MITAEEARIKTLEAIETLEIDKDVRCQLDVIESLIIRACREGHSYICILANDIKHLDVVSMRLKNLGYRVYHLQGGAFPAEVHINW